jgi:hypothetical protein
MIDKELDDKNRKIRELIAACNESIELFNRDMNFSDCKDKEVLDQVISILSDFVLDLNRSRLNRSNTHSVTSITFL